MKIKRIPPEFNVAISLRSVKVDAREKRLEAGIGANRVRHGLDCQINQAVVALVDRAIQPSEGLIFVAEAEIDAGVISYRDVAMAGQSLQIGQYSQCPGSVAGHC